MYAPGPERGTAGLTLHEKYLLRREFLAQKRKDAKRRRVPKGFLCAFAPLREKPFLPPTILKESRTEATYLSESPLPTLRLA